MPEWWNWQTRWTQNPVRLTPHVGSNPTSGTMIRCSSLVARISQTKYKILLKNKRGFEAKLSASRGGKVSGANDSETGRFGRRSGARGEKKSHLRHHDSLLVANRSYLANKTLDTSWKQGGGFEAKLSASSGELLRDE